MNPSPRRAVRRVGAVLLAGLLLPGLAAQAAARRDGCPDVGSTWRAARLEDGPPLGCAHAPGAPAWRLYTPGHGVAVPRVGHRPAPTLARPRWLIRYRCTGLRSVPVEVVEVRNHGHVLDERAAVCR